MKPGDLVQIRKGVTGAGDIGIVLGLAVVLEYTGRGYEILTNQGEIKWVFYDALELVEPVQPPEAVV